MIVLLSSDIQSIIDTNQNEPYLIIVGDADNPTQIFVAVEKRVLTEISSVSDILYGLLSPFFVLNLFCLHGCNNMYLF